jgi:hypothetical protein
MVCKTGMTQMSGEISPRGATSTSGLHRRMRKGTSLPWIKFAEASAH